MKKSAAILFSALLLAAAAVNAETSIYETGFETSDKFQPGALDLSGSPWKTSGAYPFEIKASSGDGHGLILESATEKAGEGSRAWVTDIDFKTASKITVEMDVKAVRSGTVGYQANIHLGNFEGQPKTKSEGTAALVSLRGSGRMVAFDGDAERELKSFKDGEWLHLRIDADSDAKTYSVAVDGETLASDLAFRDPATTGIASFGLTHYSGTELTTPCSMAIDNLKITGQ